MSSLMDIMMQDIHIPVYYKVLPSKYSKKIIVYSDEEYEELSKEDNHGIEILNTIWVNPSWNEEHDITENAIITNPINGEREISMKKYRMERVSRCMKDWDLKGENGKKIDFEIEIVFKLLPANVLENAVEKYEESIAISEEDKKK